MISAETARMIRDINNPKETIVIIIANIEEGIVKASKKGHSSYIYEWNRSPDIPTLKSIVGTLRADGYEVKEIRASHYYEYGALYIVW